MARVFSPRLDKPISEFAGHPPASTALALAACFAVEIDPNGRHTRLQVDCASVLAAHGWSDGGPADPHLSAMAEDVKQRTSFGQVVAAYHLGSPHYSEVLDRLAVDEVVVVPFMTSSGYFCTNVVPRELAKNDCYEAVSLRQTSPVGVDPRIVDLVGDRVVVLQRTFDLPVAGTTVAIVGHGTTRHEASRKATIDLSVALANRDSSLEVIAAFLDDEPSVDGVIPCAAGSAIIVIPFLMANGHHALVDVPARIGLDPSHLEQLPYCGSVNGRTVVYDSPVGTYKGIAKIVAAMAEEAR